VNFARNAISRPLTPQSMKQGLRDGC
jgi:hypothetical protein